MSGNTFGRIFCLTTFGESHGPALGGIVDGCPAGLALDTAFLQSRLDRRRPGTVGTAGHAGTSRCEADSVRVLSGVFEGRTTGTPIAFVIENTDHRSHDYGNLATVYRPGHADITYDAKYGLRDYRGGGRSSGRETVARVAGGAIAEAMLARHTIYIDAAAIALGGLGLAHGQEADMVQAHSRAYYAAHEDLIPQWDALVQEARSAGDTLGGVVQIVARGVPAGLGEPVFGKLDAVLAAALMSVGAVKAVEIGAGFAAAALRGSQNNDSPLPYAVGGGPQCSFASNHAGGILGGISTGQNIILRAAVKPIPSIAMEQNTIDTQGNAARIRVGGRHDVCAIPRIVPVLAAMTALVLADAVLLQQRMRV